MTTRQLIYEEDELFQLPAQSDAGTLSVKPSHSYRLAYLKKLEKSNPGKRAMFRSEEDPEWVESEIGRYEGKRP